MTVAVPVHSHARAEIPAVVHGDGTARVQIVNRGDNPRFWRILDEFERLCGVPVLVNTSRQRSNPPPTPWQRPNWPRHMGSWRRRDGERADVDIVRR